MLRKPLGNENADDADQADTRGKMKIIKKIPRLPIFARYWRFMGTHGMFPLTCPRSYGSGLASGVYFAQFSVRDESGNVRFSKISKLILAK